MNVICFSLQEVEFVAELFDVLDLLPIIYPFLFIIYFSSTKVVTLACLLQILIGNADYNCLCVRYVKSEDSEDVSLIIILSVGFGVLLILIIIAIVMCIAYACRHKRGYDTNVFYNTGAACIEFDEGGIQFCAVPAAEAVDDAKAYCSPGPVEPDDKKEYQTVGGIEPPDPPNENSPSYFSPEKDYAC